MTRRQEHRPDQFRRRLIDYVTKVRLMVSSRNHALQVFVFALSQILGLNFQRFFSSFALRHGTSSYAISL